MEEIEKSDKKQDAEEVLTPSAVDPISLKKITFLDKIWTFLATYKSTIIAIFLVILNILVFIYFGFATHFFVEYSNILMIVINAFNNL